jgi:hypothetical protein
MRRGNVQECIFGGVQLGVAKVQSKLGKHPAENRKLFVLDESGKEHEIALPKKSFGRRRIDPVISICRHHQFVFVRGAQDTDDASAG